MDLDKIKSFAKENGYTDVEYLNSWNGYEVYEPIMFEDEVAYIGLPLVILVKDDQIRMSTPEESMEQLQRM